MPLSSSCRYACVGVTSTPSRASAIAGSISSAHGREPNCRQAVSSPSGTPGTATDAGPMWYGTTAPLEKSMSSASMAAGSTPPPGTATKKSSRRVVRSRARWMSMNPPPPAPVSGDSATHDAKHAATAASIALPPSLSTRAPTSAVTGWPAAMAPRILRSVMSIGLRPSHVVSQMLQELNRRKRALGIGAIGLAAVIVVAATPQLLGAKVGGALDDLDEAAAPWLWLAGILFATAIVCWSLAWRAVVRACGGEIGPVDSAARYGVGSGVNTVAPARLGDAVRIALFSAKLPNRERVW